MRVEARVATHVDLHDLVRLADLAVAEKLQQRGGLIWSITEFPRPGVETAISEALAADDAMIAVGIIDRAIVGFCAVTLLLPRDGGRRIADVRALFVEDGARGVGVGEALMSMVIDWSRSMDCRGVDSIALPGDRGTKNFFESFGLVARAIRVHKKL